MQKEEANRLLKKHQSHTLGEGIRIARKDKIYPDALLASLDIFLTERNWLVHKCISQNRDEMCENNRKNNFLQRIKAISHKAYNLQREIETDLIEFSESVGLDMSKVRAAIESLSTFPTLHDQSLQH